MMRIELCKSHFCFATCSLFASDHRPYREGPDRLKKVEELVSSCLRPPPTVDLFSAPRGPAVCPSPPVDFLSGPALWTSCLTPWTSCLPPTVDFLSAPPPWTSCLHPPMDLFSVPRGPAVCPPSRGLPAWPRGLPVCPHCGLPICPPWTSCLPPVGPAPSCLAPWTSCLLPVDLLPAPRGPPACFLICQPASRGSTGLFQFPVSLKNQQRAPQSPAPAGQLLLRSLSPAEAVNL